MLSILELAYRVKAKHKFIFLLAIPLALSAFTHIWNPVGFPAVHPDEGTYMRRAMHVLEGLGAQDPASQFDHTQLSTSSYDHPYFGQIFLASVFKLVGYPFPDLIANNSIQSIEMLYTIPRVIMGVLAIIDTFLVYKISARFYNNKVALIASVLFAVMPLSWLLRRIVLDSIMLPLVLTSIYFAVSYTKNSSLKNNQYDKKESTSSILTILLSGIFLGLAIFTKLPAFSVIPLIGFLLFFGKSRERRWKILGLWLIPVVSIPLIWPVYAISEGDFDQWLSGVLWQGSQRQGEGKTLEDVVTIFFRLDPVLLFLGVAGFVYAAIKKDFFPLLWAIPYIFLMYAVGWATHFHWILVLPVFCIAAASILSGFLGRLFNNKRAVLRLLSYVAISTLAVFGLVNTTILITSDLSLAQFQATAFVSQDIQSTDTDTTLISSPIYSWIFKYILHRDHVFAHIRDSSESLQTKQILLIVDATFHHVLAKVGEDKKQVEIIKTIHNNTYPIANFRDTVIRYDMKDYPYTNMREADIGGGQIVVQGNY
jgi:4-amino-4-deoxy-L-arabinose transferase-like glycosyltransferase